MTRLWYWNPRQAILSFWRALAESTGKRANQCSQGSRWAIWEASFPQVINFCLMWSQWMVRSNEKRSILKSGGRVEAWIRLIGLT